MPPILQVLELVLLLAGAWTLVRQSRKIDRLEREREQLLRDREINLAEIRRASAAAANRFMQGAPVLNTKGPSPTRSLKQHQASVQKLVEETLLVVAALEEETKRLQQVPSAAMRKPPDHDWLEMEPLGRVRRLDDDGRPWLFPSFHRPRGRQYDPGPAKPWEPPHEEQTRLCETPPTRAITVDGLPYANGTPEVVGHDAETVPGENGERVWVPPRMS